jgi:hypothetical protein
MASLLYPLAKESFLKGEIALQSNDIRCVLVDTGAYTYSASHQFLSDVAVGARIAVSTALQSKTTTSGVFDAADITINGVSGATVEAVIVYQHTGSDGTARLIAYVDNITPQPFIPNSGNVTITFDNGSNKIFGI